MKHLILFLLFCKAVTTMAQKPAEVLKMVNTANTNQRNFYFELPFEYRQGWIVIKVKIKGDYYDYIFDTGGYNDITDEMQAKYNFPILTKQTVGAAAKIKAQLNIVKVDSLQIGELIFTDIAAFQLNVSNSPSIKCTINGALIGASVIKNFIWQIDYPNRKIIVTDQLDKLKNLNTAVRIPVTFNSRLMPYLNLKINGNDEQVLFDTGSSDLLHFTEKGTQKYIKNKKLITVNGGVSEGGNGTLKEKIQVVNIDSLAIGTIKFQNWPAIFSKSSNEMLIGSPIIKNFIVTLNFKSNEIYFGQTGTPQDGWETFGMGIGFANGKTIISSVFSGLAAERAGLKIDDEIISVNKVPIHYQDVCEAINKGKELLRNEKELLINVKRSGQLIEVKLVKEKVF